MYKKRSWKSFGNALQGAGIGIFVVFVLTINGSLADGDYLTLIILFMLSMLFIVPGTMVKRWARKNGKE